MEKWTNEGRRKEKKIKGAQLKEMFPFHKLWSYTKVRVPYASKSCSAMIIKWHSGERGGLWGCGEAWRSENYTLDLLLFQSYTKSRVLLFYTQGVQQYLKTKTLHHFSMIDPLVQICRLVPWEASGDSGVNFPAFCEIEVSHRSWVSSTHWIVVSWTCGKEWEQKGRLQSCCFLDAGYCRVFCASFWIWACFCMKAIGWQDCCKYS